MLLYYLIINANQSNNHLVILSMIHQLLSICHEKQTQMQQIVIVK